jgi:hypothetical protein
MKRRHTAIGVLLAVLLAVLPFSSTLGAQHALAGADFGHTHSDFDLCDWLKIQTTGSLSFDLDALWPFLSCPDAVVVQTATVVHNGVIITSGPPRAPPSL